MPARLVVASLPKRSVDHGAWRVPVHLHGKPDGDLQLPRRDSNQSKIYDG